MTDDRRAFYEHAFDAADRDAFEDAHHVESLDDELALLRLFAGSLGKTLSRFDIADRTGVNERSVDVQITRLRRKIEPDPRSPGYLQTVWGEGYILVPD